MCNLLYFARGTAYARLDRLEQRGVILGYGPQVNPSAAGFTVLAFISLEIAQLLNTTRNSVT